LRVRTERARAGGWHRPILETIVDLIAERAQQV
jgi:hypothetical protein